MGQGIIRPKQRQGRISRKNQGQKEKNRPFLTCEKLTLGLCTQGKLYLLLLVIYVLTKASQKELWGTKSIKDPQSHSLEESFTLIVAPSKYVFRKHRRDKTKKEELFFKKNNYSRDPLSL